MHKADLATEIDAAGNLIGRWEAGEGPAVVIGSHLDTVTSGGRFDGALGVLTGLDVVRRLRA
ncbi:MAG: Zn-dependent hydrolase, partial [Chloroflexi bacterium]|nr:Zn-dependent hydrolase [Chloroflexota bacterium]